MKRCLLSALALAAIASPASADRRVEKMNIPEEHRMGEQTLRLQGTGVGRATFLRLKVFLAALYTESPLRSAQSLREAAGPLRMDFTFLRRVDAHNNARAWDYHFREFNDRPYAESARDLAVFKQSLGALHRGTVQSFELTGDQTRFYEGGVLKCVIPGKGFQRSFLSIWASDKREQRNLQKGLLGVL